jgi:molybdopterin molybdotransferase
VTAETQAEYPSRIAFAEAAAIVTFVAAEYRLPSERIPVGRTAGRVLADGVVAGMALPAFDNSAMDGFALRASDLSGDETRLQLIGEQFAGRALDLRVGPGACVRITTGAPMPAGADAVVMKENARVDGEQVIFAMPVEAGTHVRFAGEDVQPGDVLLRAGTRVTPAQASLAAAVGLPELAVHRRPSVALFTTGDELREPGQSLGSGEIYDSNRALLQNLLIAEGLEPVAWPILPDDPARMRALLRDAADAFDIVMTCGGVSAGEKDYLPKLLQDLGHIHFWKVLMRPGMPLLFGQIGNAQVLGLPGNPVSVLATFLTLGRMLFDGLQGVSGGRGRIHARLAKPLRKLHNRREYLRGLLQYCPDATLQVTPHPADGSHRLRGAADSDCLIVLPEAAQAYSIGALVEVLRYG